MKRYLKIFLLLTLLFFVLPLGSTDGRTKYDAGYIYYFTVTINSPQEITIVETGLKEWIPGTNPTPGGEI